MGPLIKDTLKEDKPLNKGQSKKYTLIQPPKEDNLFSKGQEDGLSIIRRLHYDVLFVSV